MRERAIQYVSVVIDGHEAIVEPGNVTDVLVGGLRVECVTAADADRMAAAFTRLARHMRAEHQRLRARHEAELVGRAS